MKPLWTLPTSPTIEQYCSVPLLAFDCWFRWAHFSRFNFSVQSRPYPFFLEPGQIWQRRAGQNQYGLIWDGSIGPDLFQSDGPLRANQARPSSINVGNRVDPYWNGVEQLAVHDRAEQLLFPLLNNSYIWHQSVLPLS